MLKFVIEAWSDVSLDDALSQAMRKASEFLSRGKDLHVSILELKTMPDGRHKAVLEIAQEVITKKKEFEIEGHVKGHVRGLDHEFRMERREERAREARMVGDHFVYSLGNWCPDIPDYFTAHMGEAEISGDAIEHEFLSAAHGHHYADDIPDHKDDAPELHHVLGKKHDHGSHEPEPH